MNSMKALIGAALSVFLILTLIDEEDGAVRLIPVAHAEPVVGAAAPDFDAMVSQCQSCHQGGLDLRGKDTEALLAIIREIGAGAKPHPVPVPPMSDEDMARLAKRLSCAE